MTSLFCTQEVYFKPSTLSATSISGDSTTGPLSADELHVSALHVKEILVYYLPYQIGDWRQHNPASYTKPPADPSAGWEESDRWQRDVTALLRMAPHSIPNVSSVSYEARGPNYGQFNRFTDMERVATAAEVDGMLAQAPDKTVLLFLEPRDRPIVMRDRVPVSWALSGLTDGVTPVQLGNASSNEYFVFQIVSFSWRTLSCYASY